MDCSVAQCLEVVGEWWSMLIVRDAFLGVTRFDDFQRRLGISRNILHDQRLDTLVDAGVLTGFRISEHPAAARLPLTDKGRDLWPVSPRCGNGATATRAPSGPPLVVTHKACGAVTEAVMVCSSCGERIGARDVHAAVSPGHEPGALIPARA